MAYILKYLEAIFGNLYLLLFVTCVFFLIKSYILLKLIVQINKKIHQHYAYFFLILVLIGSIFSDLTWIFCIIRSLWIPTDYRIYLFMLRIAWGLSAIQFQSLALFLEKLVEQSPSLSLKQKITYAISILFFAFAVALSIIDFNCFESAKRPFLEIFVRNAELYYLFFILMPYSIFLVIWKTYTHQLPLILKKQIKVLLPIAIIPILISELLQTFPLVLSSTITTNSYSAVCLSNILLIAAVYYCTRRVIALRFLNLTNHVEVKTRYSFINSFKDVLEKLSHATSNSEIQHITQVLFKESFGIPINKTHLFIRQTKTGIEPSIQYEKTNTTKSLVESFIAANGQGSCGSGKSAKILIYDEIDFNNFYEKSDENIALLSFLETINADIFMPIYEKNNMTAYIIVERFARLNNFYGTTERDEMLVYASYLGNVINLFQTCNLDTLAQQEKELQDELYQKHQEINQYKESIRSFLRTAHDKEIGVVFYQNRRFIFGNKSARDFVQININAQEGHPISKALRHVARQVEEYKTPIKQFALDNAGNKLVLSGVPNLEKNNVIITMYYPEISDIIKKQTEHFNDPTKWDYLLYLETTESGKLINKLIPGSGETLLNFKIDLLKIALSKRAILLEMPTHDIMPTVEIIHHISLREQLHCLKLNSASRSNNETIIKIFGIDPLFSITVPKTSLLEELDNTGTLFIENVHLLSMEAQEYLTEFLKYGSFRMYKSNQKKTSTARIICSTNQNLQTLTHEGTFSKELFNILRKNTVSMPSLLTLADNELCELADGFTEQSLKSMPMKNLLELTNSEKNRLVHARPASIHELKEKVQHLLTQKSKRNMIEEETQFDPAYQFTDPHLMQAARLGKHALRDPKIMALLWNKFKSQSKIATFLGVNRSSVNRRCKDYHLITPEDESSE